MATHQTMNLQLKNIKAAYEVKLATILLCSWGILAFLYTKFSKFNDLKIFGSLILCISQLGADIFITISAYYHFKKNISTTRKILLFLTIAFAIQTLVDVNLNITVYILNHYPLNPVSELSIEIPFFIFQIFLFLFYLQIAKVNKIVINKNEIYSAVYLFPFLFVILSVLYFFIFSYKWEIDTFSVSGTLQIIAVILNLMVFISALFCLAASSNSAIFCISTGILVLVSSDTIERFSILTTSYQSSLPFQMIWTLGLWIIIFGLLLAKHNKPKNFMSRLLLPVQSIQVQYTLWCFLVSIFSLSAFIIFIESFFNNNNNYHNVIVKYTSSALIIFSVISVLFSKLFSRKMSLPFQKIIPILNAVSNANYQRKTEEKLETIVTSNKSSILEINELSKFIVRAFNTYKEKAHAERKLSETALQVAHDIRSPLTALDLVIKDIINIPEEQRILIRNATSRIHDIANNLLTHYKSEVLFNTNESAFSLNSELILDLVLTVVSEKRIQYKNLMIDFSTDMRAHGLFAKISASDFKRVLSNLLNNAVESTDHVQSPSIGIKLFTEQNFLTIRVHDNGCGIPHELLQNIMKGTISTRKEKGHGLGLSYALKAVKENWRGELKIHSLINKGTVVDIIIPITSPPSWFATELTILKEQTIVILDDDSSIHHVWRKRFEEMASKITFVHHYQSNTFLTWVSTNFKPDVLFLIDYELLGDSQTGIEVITAANIASQAFLATSRHEEAEIRDQCMRLGLKIIPKSFAAYIPIQVRNNVVDLLLVDDDIFLTDIWKFKASLVGKKIKTFNTVKDLYKEIDTFNKDVPIYIDYNLNDTLSGEDLGKDIFNKGFTNLYLATGYNQTHFKEIPWIKKIVGKEPPF